MKLARWAAGTALLFPIFVCIAQAQEPALEPPKAGPVEIFPLSAIQPGLKGTAWSVFLGTKPEAIPVEILGRWKNAWGPGQDVILAKLGGKAARTNVAGGMSGSPVYIDGKLVGAIALRLSIFSPDAICGITPIESMLEIKEIDGTRPSDARAPAMTALSVPGEVLAAAAPRLGGMNASLVPIGMPLAFSGFHQSTLEQFTPLFEQMGVEPVLGGAAGDTDVYKRQDQPRGDGVRPQYPGARDHAAGGADRRVAGTAGSAVPRVRSCLLYTSRCV